MKQFLEKIWNFAKQYPFTSTFIFIFLLANIIGFTPYLHFFDMIPTGCVILSFMQLMLLGTAIFLFIKKFGDKNRFVKGIILFFINVFFWCANSYISDKCWAMSCRIITNPDTYVKVMSVNGCPTNWEQFGNGLYLNTECICYYKDKDNNHHAVITKKHIKDKSNANIDNICIKYYGEPFEYMYTVTDMNLTKKTETLLLFVFFNNGHKIGSLDWDKTNPENTTSVSTDTNLPIGRIYQYLMSQNKFMHAAIQKYMKDVHKKVEKNWKPYDKNEKGTINIQFKVYENGKVSDIKIKSSNVSKNNENSVIDAIKKSAPFKPLPKDIDTNDKGAVYMDFVFNMNKGYKK